MSIYCVYLTTYSGNKLPPFYIGSSSKRRIESGYRGSVLSKKYKEIWKQELTDNPHLFKTRIICTYKSSEESREKELKLQKLLNVVHSDMYINMSFASPKGFFGMDVSKENNPNFGKIWNNEQRKRNGKTQKLLRQKFPEKYYDLPPMSGENNPRWKDGKTTFRDKNGNTVFTHKNDPRVLSKELFGVGTNSKKANETKSKNINMKKYLHITLKSTEGELITLQWNEYKDFFQKHKISGISGLGKKFTLIEAKLNPNF